MAMKALGPLAAGMAALVVAMTMIPSHAFSRSSTSTVHQYIIGHHQWHRRPQRPSATERMRMSSTNIDELESRFASLRSIGVDYGLARTGVAITTGGYRPRPLAILSGLNNTQLATAIVNHVQSEQASNVVLGLPLHKNGTDSEQSDITRAFGQELLREVRTRCGSTVALVLWDERYTSKEAASRITAEAMARNQRIPSASDLETELDADAACIILEDYYKERGVDAERVLFDDPALEIQCEEAYRENLERAERDRIEMMEERERGRNARREMMERVRAEEEAMAGAGAVGDGKRKKKKKKKKR